MKSQLKYRPFVILALFVFSFSCKKPSTSSTCTGTSGGKGGGAQLIVTAEHANAFIDSCKFYIKYGSCDAPASGIYDDSLPCVPRSATDTTPIATFKGLTTGNYYLYGVGYHKGYTPPYVAGGLSWTIYHNTDSLQVYVPTYSYNQ